MKWLHRRRRQILKEWRENSLTYADAVAQLVGTGMSLEVASNLVAST